HAITSVKLVIRSFNIATPDVTIETKEVIAAPKSEANGVKDFSSWTATIPLTATAENEIKVVAIDDRENEITVEQANKVVIRQADVKSAFPDEINQFVQLPQAIALDKNADRNRILVSDQEYDVIYSVNLDSGQRTTFIEIKNDDCSNQAEGLVLDATNNKLYAFCNIQPKTVLLEYNLISGELENSYATSSDTYVYGGALDRHNGRNQIVFATHIDHANVWEEENGGVYAFNLDTKTFSIISAKENQQIPLVENRHIVVNGDQYLLTSGAFMDDAESRKVISVDALTGSRNVLSSNAVGAGELFRGLLPDGRVAQILGLYVQPQFGRVLVSEVGGKLFSINLKTGDRTVFKQLSYAQTVVESLPATRDIDIDTINDVAYIDDNRRKAILIFDLETQEKVILSKSKNNF
ncbi:MAG TPA: hypothetical protein VL995_05385, partial [Cellvibrio sp.]|nr:hypothetical protein [Cellvibrio sp.]